MNDSIDSNNYNYSGNSNLKISSSNIIWSEVGINSVRPSMNKEYLKEILDSDNPEIKDTVNIILQYLISKLETILNMDKPIDHYIQESFENMLRDPEAVKKIQMYSESLYDFIIDLDNKLNTKLREIHSLESRLENLESQLSYLRDFVYSNYNKNKDN